MITIAWDLADQADYTGLNLRRWAHMLGFRGHFLTKSHRYSTTFTALRRQRRTWRLIEDLTRLGRDTHDPGDIAPDPDSVTVINDWWPIHYGHRDEGERDLAAAIADRHRSQQRSRTTAPPTGRAAA